MKDLIEFLVSISPFLATGPFLYPLKTSKNQRHSVIEKNLMRKIFYCIYTDIHIYNIHIYIYTYIKYIYYMHGKK